jgi:hypothetical protein
LKNQAANEKADAENEIIKVQNEELVKTQKKISWSVP